MPPITTQKPLILLAEDDPKSERELAQALEQAGYRVVTTRTATGTLHMMSYLVTTDKPSVTVISLQLGDFSNPTNKAGLVAASKAQELHIPVIMTYVTADRAVKLEAMGGQKPLALALLDKADGPNPILAEISRVLDNRLSPTFPVG